MNYESIMEIRQLRYFVAVAEELHFGRAAERCHVSQPPLSQQIAALERELDARLFTRTSRRVALTAEGRALLPEAREVLAGVDRAVRIVRNTNQGRTGRIRLGYVGPAMDTAFPQAVGRYRQEHPGVELAMEWMTTERQLAALREDVLDAGVIRDTGRDAGRATRGLILDLFWTEPYVLAVPEGHPFAGEKHPMPLSRLAGEPMISFPPSMLPGLHRAIGAAFDKAGGRPVVVQEVRDKRTALALTAAGMGISLATASMAARPVPGVAFVALGPGLPPVRLSVARPPDSGLAVERLIREILRRARLEK